MIKEHRKYLEINPKRYWFKAKLYGWGWVPATWQGWLITGIYLLLVILVSSTLSLEPTFWRILSLILIVEFLTLVFIFIAFKKGEKPRWQWGLPKQDKKD